MVAMPQAWKKDPRVLMRLLQVWASPKRLKRHLYPPSPGPKKAELFEVLGLSLKR
jgi:hypothetical protein